ncbi:MAG: Lrp/AsnC ligand binding domain-containing protein [Thermoplasmata archaeon]
MEMVYVLINTLPGTLEKVYGELIKKPGVVDASIVTGPYDIVAKIEGNKITEALGTVVREVRRIEGIKSTETLVVVKM